MAHQREPEPPIPAPPPRAPHTPSALAKAPAVAEAMADTTADKPDDTPEALVAAVRAVAAARGTDRLSMAAFRKAARVSDRRIYRHFESWRELCRAAGLRPVEARRAPSDAEAFRAMRDGFVAAGGIVPFHRLERHLPWSAILPRRRWGGWQSALAAFRDWVADNDPDFPHMAALVERLGRPARRARAEGPGPPWPALGGRAAGAPLALPAMACAPVNELGVVLLFGMLADALGYIVETVQPGFPDATARRRIAPGRWESVRLEFEYRSRSFREHGHDPDGCDVIVCWEHDWPAAPLEVLALNEAVAAMAARAA